MADLRPRDHHPRCPLRTLTRSRTTPCRCGEYGWSPEGAASVPWPGREIPPPPSSGSCCCSCHRPEPRTGWRDGPCAACGRPVRQWKDGAIIDPDPTDEGDVVILDGVPTRVIREDVIGRFTLYRSHLYTCPERLDASVEVQRG